MKTFALGTRVKYADLLKFCGEDILYIYTTLCPDFKHMFQFSTERKFVTSKYLVT